MEYEHNERTYQIDKVGLRDGQRCLKLLTDIKFLDEDSGGMGALIASPDEVVELEQILFRSNVRLLNDKGDWIPLGKSLTEKHFDDDWLGYYILLSKTIAHNLSDFLLVGRSTGLEEAGENPE